jgi:hypothetical protein
MQKSKIKSRTNNTYITKGRIISGLVLATFVYLILSWMSALAERDIWKGRALGADAQNIKLIKQIDEIKNQEVKNIVSKSESGAFPALPSLNGMEMPTE